MKLYAYLFAACYFGATIERDHVFDTSAILISASVAGVGCLVTRHEEKRRDDRERLLKDLS